MGEKRLDDLTGEEMIYFSGDEALLPVYLKLREEILALYPECGVLVQKSQISFRMPRPFAWVWTLSGHGSRKPGSGPLFVTFASPYPVDSPLIHTRVEPYPGRWTHHVALQAPDEVSAELILLIQASFAFRNGK